MDKTGPIIIIDDDLDDQDLLRELFAELNLRNEIFIFPEGESALEYLSNPVGEHIPPGQSFIQTSKDGYKWSAPAVAFPPYKIPDGTKKGKLQWRSKGPYRGNAPAYGLLYLRQEPFTDVCLLWHSAGA